MARKNIPQAEDNPTASFNADVELIRQAFERHANRAVAGQPNPPVSREVAAIPPVNEHPNIAGNYTINIDNQFVHPAPIPAPVAEAPVIQVRNGDYLYWNGAHNRWFVRGIPEAQQLARRTAAAPQPALRGSRASAPLDPIPEALDREDLPQAPEPAVAHYQGQQPIGYIDEPGYQAVQQTITVPAQQPQWQEQTFQIHVDTAYATTSYAKTAKVSSSKFAKAKAAMTFDSLSEAVRIDVMRKEFASLVKSVFDTPESLKGYVSGKKLSKDQARAIFKSLHKLNVNKCPCCRKFDAKLLTAPIDPDFEPLIDLARETVKAKAY